MGPADQEEVIKNTMSSPDFIGCMTEWGTGDRLEPKFGTQADGSLKWYDNVPKEELAQIECLGGRGSYRPPVGRLIEDYDVGHPRTFSVRPVCWSTKNGMCFPPPYGGVCLFPTPGSADCGAPEAPCGTWGEKEGTPECNRAKNVSTLDCVALAKDFVKVDDFDSYFCHEQDIPAPIASRPGGPTPAPPGPSAKSSKCVENAVVGECLIMGCFMNHGQASCRGTKCYCNAGYCSIDGSFCQPTPQTERLSEPIPEIIYS